MKGRVWGKVSEKKERIKRSDVREVHGAGSWGGVRTIPKLWSGPRLGN